MKLDFAKYLEKTGEVGFVDRVISPSLLYANGLPGAKPRELVIFETGEIGEIMSLGESSLEIINFSKTTPKTGTRVTRTDHGLEIPVGRELLGATVNPLGHSLLPEKPLPILHEIRPVETIPASINTRVRITTPCDSGVSLIDLLLPLGKGQRELVIGDQKSGKSFFLIRALAAQVKSGTMGIYALIGKSKIATHQIEETMKQFGIREKIILVVSNADDAAGVIFLTPYTAMTIAEYFRDLGQDVLLVLDDLSLHAKAYREIALLGRRFPGRNSYPGDMFYAHARLLERAGNFRVGEKEQAITCIPVVEAVQGDITGHIQTNVMSITDGHIFFDHRFFAEGRRPAVDPFISVTRVGRQTQTLLRQEIGRLLINFLRNAEHAHQFATLGAELSPRIREMFEKEDRIMQLFDQTGYEVIPAGLQVFLFGAVWSDFWKGKSRAEIAPLIKKIYQLYEKDDSSRSKIDDAVKNSNSVEALVNRLQNLHLLEEVLKKA